MRAAEPIAAWDSRFRELAGRLAPRFRRKDLRGRAEGYIRGLLGRVERKNSWQLAEAAGDATPHGIQRLLGRSRWDADAVRDDLRSYVVEHLGEPDGVLIVDETGFLKKGTKSAGVARQYSGTAGRIENSQVGVFLAYRSGRGAAFVDRALYLPKAWAEDPQRRRGAGIPEEAAFATKPELARAMLRRALRAGVPARWVTADEAYGSDHKFRRLVEDAGLSYVVAVTSAQRLFLGGSYDRADAFADELPADAWMRLSCGAGTKGQRFYDWAFVAFPFQSDAEFAKGLLVRRSIAEPSERAYYLCRFPRGTRPEELARVAGCRWAIESAFEQAKQEVGLDDYEVRSWDGWHRHMTLALLAHAFLEVLRTGSVRRPPPKIAGSQS
ncbi:MAG: IS701 family transposase [Isosphaeraceae bacterium]